MQRGRDPRNRVADALGLGMLDFFEDKAAVIASGFAPLADKGFGGRKRFARHALEAGDAFRPEPFAEVGRRARTARFWYLCFCLLGRHCAVT